MTGNLHNWAPLTRCAIAEASRIVSPHHALLVIQPYRFIANKSLIRHNLGMHPPSFPFCFGKAFFTARLIGWPHELVAALAGFSDQDLALRSDDFLDWP